MKAKYCPCLGVKLFAVGRGDIGEDRSGFELAGADKDILPLEILESNVAGCPLQSNCRADGVQASSRRRVLGGCISSPSTGREFGDSVNWKVAQFWQD